MVLTYFCSRRFREAEYHRDRPKRPQTRTHCARERSHSAGSEREHAPPEDSKKVEGHAHPPAPLPKRVFVAMRLVRDLICRPPWNESTTAEELDQKERDSFLQWRRVLAGLQEDQRLTLTPFEKNLELWRQLWRVVERRY